MRKRWGLTAVGAVITAAYLFPVYWMVATSLKDRTDIFSSPPKWVPWPPRFDAYHSAVLDNPVMLRALGNSAIIAVGTVIMTLLLAAPAGYGMARLKLRWTGLMMLPFLVSQLVPTINLAVPLYLIFSRTGLVNTQLSLIIANTIITLPFAVILLRPFFLRVPAELEEAAATDGCGRLGAFWRIVLPIVRPGLLTVAVFAFVMTWGEFAMGLTLTTDERVQPVTVILNQFIGQYGTEWAPLMAASTIVALPIVILFVGLQRLVVGGLAAGAVKE
ncbi:carbohydrate ABC transporter permease [Phytohabitans flavus]|uniref:Sugar ABC transporter permease n=1 Tax=Phytohabitans flavus TaxID=1076124 RepID=A0A6F8XN85_9ACTN|nr:carbohydrate ABC transporter permease [Phytohabitans flavus]BCB75259.1 sugar ABC transporter permease [Phytohabitans flavus]